MPTEASWKTLKDYLLLRIPISVLCACHRGPPTGNNLAADRSEKAMFMSIRQDRGLNSGTKQVQTLGHLGEEALCTATSGRGSSVHWDIWEGRLAQEDHLGEESSILGPPRRRDSAQWNTLRARGGSS